MITIYIELSARAEGIACQLGRAIGLYDSIKKMIRIVEYVGKIV